MGKTSTVKSTRDTPEGRGVITFLDILGWKGAYSRNQNPIKLLLDIIEDHRVLLNPTVISRAPISPDFRSILGRTVITSISDTVVISTPTNGDPSYCINIHAHFCRDMIIKSIKCGIPFRGVISYGDFVQQENVFMGRAVDEASSWFTMADWIGVHMTPSADFAYTAVDGEEDIFSNHQVPFKSGIDWNPKVVNWVQNQSDDCKMSMSELRSAFTAMSPITPDVINKYTNTIKYFNSFPKV